jgi:hypothetical protein
MSPISDELAVLRSRPTLDHLVKMVAHTDVPQPARVIGRRDAEVPVERPPTRL